MRKLTKVALAVAAMAFGVARADVAIDLLAGDQGPVSDGSSAGNVVWASQVGPVAGTLGGYRDIGVMKLADSTSGSGLVTMVVEANGPGRVLRWSNASGVVGMGVARWDGITDASAGPSVLTFVTEGSGFGHYTSSLMGTLAPIFDLDAAGDSFVFTVLESDLDFSFWFELTDTDGTVAKFKFESQAHVNTQSTPLPVAAFTGLCGAFMGFGGSFDDPTDGDNNDVLGGYCAGGDNLLNTASISSIQIILQSDQDCGTSNNAICTVDLAIEALRVIPEPNVLALAGLSLVGLAAASRRRRKS
jgi:PEP-CTERM motif